MIVDPGDFLVAGGEGALQLLAEAFNVANPVGVPLVEVGAFGFEGTHGVAGGIGCIEHHGAGDPGFGFQQGDFEFLLLAGDDVANGVLHGVDGDIFDAVGGFVRADPVAVRAGDLHGEDLAGSGRGQEAGPMAAAEDGDDGFTERGGDVHRAGIFAEVAFRVGGEADERVQPVGIGGHVECFAGELAHLGADGGCGFVFGRSADEDEMEAVIPHHGGADIGPFLERPVLEPGVGGAFTGADDPELAFGEAFLAEAAGGGGEEAFIRG